MSDINVKGVKKGVKMAAKLGSLYKGEWPHPDQCGVGLRFEGLPNDKELFITWLMDYGCHPKAGARIYERIAANGFDLLTVYASLPFEEIAEGLTKFGVTMSVIPPQPDWVTRHHDGPFPVGFVPPHLRK